MSKKQPARFTAAVRVTAIVEVPLKAATLVDAAAEADALKAGDIFDEGYDVADFPDDAVVQWLTRA